MRPLAFSLALSLVACGGAPRSAGALAEELAALDLDEAAELAPDLVLAARNEVEEAARAESRGDASAAADHAMIARLVAARAVEEAARLRVERETLAIAQGTLDAEARILSMERASADAARELERSAAARTAREQGARALARAEVDEARRGRAVHVSLGDAAEMRAAATAIRDRARLLRAAAMALGATPPPTLETWLTRSAETDAPLESLELADRAYGAARAMLGDARRAAPGVDAARIASLAEAAESEGFHAIALERGTAIELEDVFEGSSARPTAAAAGRLARLSALLGSYPDGGIVVELDSTTVADAERLTPTRTAAVVRALVAAGVPATRVTAAEASHPSGSPTPGVRVRAVLVAYAAMPPPSGGTIVPAAPSAAAEGGASAE